MNSLISHSPDRISFDVEYNNLRENIVAKGDTNLSTVDKRLHLLEELSRFDFGQFLIVNRGMNGYWTHYVCTAEDRQTSSLSELEKFLLFKRPMALATQERFKIFKNIIQAHLFSNIQCASIPSGVMGDLLLLDYSRIKNFQLTAIDLDEQSLIEATKLAQKMNLSEYTKTINKNAWELNFNREFDLISSSGLNIYVSDNTQVVELYKQFHRALKPNGLLVTSFFTTPTEFESKVINNDLLLQRIIYSEILDFKGSCLRTYSETEEQLSEAGFTDIRFFKDSMGIFPTVTARPRHRIL